MTLNQVSFKNFLLQYYARVLSIAEICKRMINRICNVPTRIFQIISSSFEVTTSKMSVAMSSTLHSYQEYLRKSICYIYY